jgi:hypothetical protein
MFIYLCHDFWQVLAASFLIYPFLKDLEETDFTFIGLSYVILVVLTESLSLLNYFVFNFIYGKIFKKKKEVQIIEK